MEQQIEVLSRLATTLESTISNTSAATKNNNELMEFSATDIFQDSIFAPGRFCRPALQNALHQDLPQIAALLSSSEDIFQLDIASLRSVFTHAVNTAAKDHLQGRIGVWRDVVQAYTRALRSYFAPSALVKLSVHRDEEQGLLVVRSGGSVSLVRAAEPAEIVIAGAWPPIWDKMRSSDSAGVKSILNAAGVLVDTCLGGRHALMMIEACILAGAEFRARVLPAVLRWLLSSSCFSSFSAGDSGSGGNLNDNSSMSVALKIGSLCSAPKNGFASAIEAVVTLLANDCVPPGGDGRSPLASFSPPIISAAIAQGHQTAAAQCECLLRVALLTAYVTSQHTLGTWTVPEQERQIIFSTSVSDRIDWMLAAAGVAYWSTAAPIAKRSRDSVDTNSGNYGAGATASETATMVVALKIGEEREDRDGGGRDGTGGARKRARLTPSSSLQLEYAYPAEHLLATFKPRVHAVRDLPDLQQVVATFSSWLLCVPKVHDIDLRRKNTPTESIALKRTLELAPVLIRTHSAAALNELMTMVEQSNSDDPRVLFFAACSKALMLDSLDINGNSASNTSGNNSSTPSKKSAVVAAINKLEKESVSLFFMVAATFAHRTFFQQQLLDVTTTLEDLLSSFSCSSTTNRKINLPAGASETQIVAADELFYLESLMIIFEKLGCHHAASRFAMAAAQHVPTALPGEDKVEERIKRTGRLWSSIFTFCLRSGEFEEAYAALLSNDVADEQVECVHKLVNSMVERGEIASLCALPFAHTSLVVRHGQPAWVSLLDEAVSALNKRAALMDVDSTPQSYQVLFDFHVARGNYQVAASSMVSYARRLTAEAPEDRHAVDLAQKALAAAVGALGLVDSERAWLEDPRGVMKPVSSLSTRTIVARAFEDVENSNIDEEEDVLWVPRIITLADLKIEHAIAVAKSSVAAVLPGGDVGTKTATEVFHQLVALKLHQEAFTLVDIAFIGNEQQRMREIAMASLATTCAELQLQTGIGGKNTSTSYNAYASDEGMLTDDGGLAAAEEENGDLDGNGGRITTTAYNNTIGSSAASASWKRLRSNLETYEKQGSTAGAMNLRVLAIDAVLATNASLQPPLWLLSPFFPPPSEGPLSAKLPNSDVAGLLRAYLKHGRVEDAAVLAIKVLSRVADSVPSVSLPRPGAVCLPHALLEELVNRVSSNNQAVKNDLTEKLNKAQAAAERQSQVLENIYAA
jgi:nuclear pore complex protein Nup160